MHNPIILLTLGGVICFLIAILHVVIIVVGPSAYHYFGAGEDLTKMSRRGSILPAMLTAFIATILSVFGLYAFSGTGAIGPMPFRGPVLIMIGAIFSLRGLVLPYQLYTLLSKPQKAELKEIFFSLIALITGICFLYGTMMNREFIFNQL